MTLYDSKNSPASLKFSSKDPSWSQLTGRIKSLQIDSLTPTVRLSLYEYTDWTFRPSKPAKLRYTQNGRQRTITIHPTILFKTTITGDKTTSTTYRLIYTSRGPRQ